MGTHPDSVETGRFPKKVLRLHWSYIFTTMLPFAFCFLVLSLAPSTPTSSSSVPGPPSVTQCYNATKDHQIEGGVCVDPDIKENMGINQLGSMGVVFCASFCEMTWYQANPWFPFSFNEEKTPCTGFDYNNEEDPWMDCRCWLHTEAAIQSTPLTPKQDVDSYHSNTYPEVCTQFENMFSAYNHWVRDDHPQMEL